MEEMNTKKMTMRSGRLGTEVEVKVEVKEEFCAATESFHFEETAILPDKYEVQRSEQSSQFYEVMLPLSYYTRSPLRCRLCAIPNNDMVDIFSSFKTVTNIAEKIEYCLRIVVKETDTLPKLVCRSCVQELELCYQFNKTVVEAEKQLLAYDRQTSCQFEEMERHCHTSSLRNVHRSATGHHNIERTSPGIETQNKEPPTVESNLDSASLNPFSGASVSTNSHCTNNLDINRLRALGSNEHQNIDLSIDVLYPGRISASHCASDSELPRATHSSLQAGKNPPCDEGLENQENPAVHEEAYNREALYKCNLCAKTFKTFNSRRTHDKLHTGKGLHSCEYCEKKFTSRADKNRHHRIHTGERPFKCSVCEMTFIESTKLRRHAAVHSEKRNYPCSLCDKSFKHVSSRKLHMEVHAGEMTWQCDYCKKYYKRKQVLRRHVKTCKKGYRTSYHYLYKDPFPINRYQDFLIGNK